MRKNKKLLAVLLATSVLSVGAGTVATIRNANLSDGVSITATAEAAQMDPSLLFTATSGNPDITANHAQEGLISRTGGYNDYKVNHNGILISPDADVALADAGYTVDLNGIFTTENPLEIAYSFANDSASGNFTFRFTEVGDDSNYFDISIYRRSGNFATCRTSVYVNGAEATALIVRPDKGWTYNESPASFTGKNGGSATFGLEWGDAGLTITYRPPITRSADLNVATLVTTDAVSFASKNYTMSIISKYDAGYASSPANVPSIKFEGIYNEPTKQYSIQATTVDGVNTIVADSNLYGETVATPSWYVNPNEGYEITVDEYKQIYTVEENATVKAATYTANSDETGTPQNVSKTEVYKDGVLTDLTAGSPLTEAGAYVVKYYAVESSSSLTNVLEREFLVVTDYSAIESAREIALEKAYGNLYVVNEPVEIVGATYTYPAYDEVAAQPVELIEYKKASEEDGAYQTVTDSFTVAEAGDYVIRYTAVVGDDNDGNTFTQTVTVTDEALNLNNLVSVTGGATVTTAHTVTGTISTNGGFNGETATHTGILVEPATSTTPYSGEINGIFTMDNALELLYYFPGEATKSTLNGDFTFRFTDATNVNNYFEVCLVVDGNASNYGGRLFVRDNEGNIRAMTQGKIYDTYSVAQLGGVSPSFSGDNAYAPRLKLEWTDDVLTVYRHGDAVNVNTQTHSVLAKFDGTDAVDSDTGAFGLDKIAFPNGYTVSFTSALGECEYVAEGAAVAPVKIEAIRNDGTTGTTTNLSEKYVALSDIPSYYTAVAGKNIALDDGKITLNMYVKDVCKIDGATLSYTKADGTSVNESIAFSGEPTDGLWKVSVNVDAYMMSVPFTLQPMNGETPVGKASVASIQTYLDELIATPADKLGWTAEQKAKYDDMAKAALNYGAAVQTAMGYKADALANANNATELPTVTADDLTAYALVDEGNVVTDVTVGITSTFTLKIKGNFEGATVAGLEDGYTATATELVISGLTANDIATTFTVTVGDNTVAISILSFAQRILANGANETITNVVKAIYGFHTAYQA